MGSACMSSNLILVEYIFVHPHVNIAMVIEAMYIYCRNQKLKDEVAEWLRCQTAYMMGTAGMSSNPILIKFFFVHLHANFAMVIEAMYIQCRKQNLKD